MIIFKDIDNNDNHCLMRDKFIAGFIFLITWTYLWIRAGTVPLCHDEACTFFSYVQIGEFWPFRSFPDANNHLLNSFLSYLSYTALGSGKIALRLPNLLAWPLYFFSVYFLSGRIRHRYLRWILFLSLILAHNFLEFFGLCRGYGLSFGLLAMSLLSLAKSLENRKMVNCLLTVMMVALAVSANLTLMYTAIFVMLLLITVIVTGKITRRIKVVRILAVMLTGGLPVLFFAAWLFYLRKEGLLYYHSVQGFFDATPGTLGILLSGFNNSLAGGVLSILFLVVLLFVFLDFRKHCQFNAFFQHSMFFSFLLAANIAAIILGHVLLGVHYPEDRTALFLFPFLLLSLVFHLDKLGTGPFRKVFFSVAAILLFFPLHFLFSVNFCRSSQWSEEGIPQRFYDTIREQARNCGSQPAIGGYMLRRFCWGYMNYRNGGDLPMIKTSAYPEMTADYQLVHLKKDIPWHSFYDEIDYDKCSGLSLLKRKQLLLREKIELNLPQPISPGIINDEFFSLLETPVESLKTASLYIEIEGNISAEASPFQAVLVASVTDSAGNTANYEAIDLNWLRDHWSRNTASLKQGILLTRLPLKSAKLTVYIFNKKRTPFAIWDCSVSLYSLK